MKEMAIYIYPYRHCFTHLRKPILLGFLVLSGCSYFERPSEHARHLARSPAKSSKYRHEEVGKASWYGPGFQGKLTANGERFDQDKMTAGSRNLPLGTVVEVTNLKNRKKVKVKINDRGPWVRGRTLDLSRGAAEKLGMVKTGVAPVKIKISYKPSSHKKRIHRKHRRRPQ
jgi:rare lipoprotein A